MVVCAVQQQVGFLFLGFFFMVFLFYLILNWFHLFVKSGCGDFPHTNPPLSLYCLPALNEKSCPGDYDHNGIVNSNDIQVAKNAWGVCNESCPADGNGDVIVDLFDVALALDVFGPCPNATCVKRPSSLTSWWPGDVDSHDVLAVNNGVLLGNATITGDSLFGGGAFNGSYVWVPMDSAGLADFAVSMWVKFLLVPDRVNARTLFNWGTANLVAEDGLLTFSTGDGKSLSSGGSGLQLGANTWYAISVVRRNGTSLELYTNGYLINSLELSKFDNVGLPSSFLRFSADDVITDDFALFAGTGRSSFEIFVEYAQKKQLQTSYCYY
jgi:hypothetical protein